MREFFNGWRRKAGCVTLLLACVFMIGGMRSRVRCDLIMLPYGNSTYCVESMCGVLDFGRVTVENNRARASWKSSEITPTLWRYLDVRGNPQPVDHLAEADEIVWRWDWAGFHFGAGRTRQTIEEDYVIPYWSITTPLTLLSAYLILWTPRPKE